MKKTKIIATLGPASNKEQTIAAMAGEGLDVARLNFSHGSSASHIKKIDYIRRINKKRKKKIKIMQDLEGYRIRVGRLKEKKVFLKDNSVVYLSQKDNEGGPKVIPFDYRGSLARIRKGNPVYIDDGKVYLKITNVEKKRLKARVVRGGEVLERKGMNIVGAKLEFEALTDKDKKDLTAVLDYSIDFIAQSFVRGREDLLALKKFLRGKKIKRRIFAKIESIQALENLDEIIDEADGIIVARGDLGICLPIYKVPLAQKRMLEKAKLGRKPSVVATQMLESMIRNTTPTRAEVSDVANAILDGAGFLLFSGETAVGKYPVEVVKTARKIISYTAEKQGKKIF